MKKIKNWIALALTAVVVASVIPVGTVHAAKNILDVIGEEDQTTFARSGLAGTKITDRVYENKDAYELEDLIGYTYGVFADVDHETGEINSDPVCTGTLTRDDLKTMTYTDGEGEQHSYQYMEYSTILPCDLQDGGEYHHIVVDKDGKAFRTGIFFSPDTYYLNKVVPMFTTSYDKESNTVYAYTYEDSVNWDSSKVPAFYKADKTTKVAELVGGYTEESFYGQIATVLQYKVTDPSEYESGYVSENGYVDPNSYQLGKFGDSSIIPSFVLKNDRYYSAVTTSPYMSAEDYLSMLEKSGYADMKNEKGETFAEFLARIRAAKVDDEQTANLNEAFKITEDGTAYWYENGIRQGTLYDPKGVLGFGTNRGREIYDPDTNAWYWLDSKYDGARAVNKEVWVPYVFQNEDQMDDAQKREVSAMSPFMADQVYKSIVEKTGKWIRYDSVGRLIIGWYEVTSEEDKALYPDQVGNKYYYDPITGLMAKGNTVIDGVTYHFDEITGVLDK